MTHRNRSRLLQLATVSLISLTSLTSSLWSQTNTGSIRGSVSDPSGAVIPGASVVLTNTGTGVQASDKTNQGGDYLFEFLAPGPYRVEVEQKGFKRYVRDGISLDVARQLRIDVVLETGQVSESVDVTAQAAQVETENGELGTAIQNRMVTELPLLGRNPQSLALLSPGVVSTADGNVTNGGLVRKDPYYIDGVDSSNHVWSGTPINPNPDVIQEFKVLTNSYSAEYGESSGATLIAITKSGTNAYHGTLFEFWQNDALNAGDFFGHKVANLRQNQFGGTAGGPIRRNKTFFFVDTQITRSKGNVALTNLTVPTAAFRGGDFSSILGATAGTDALGQTDLKNQIFDPSTQRQITNSAGSLVWVRTPFTGNQIPVSRMSPAALKIQALYPQPQINQTFNNYSVFGANLNNLEEFDVKGDHSFRDSDRLTVRYSQRNTVTNQPSAFGTVAGGPQPGVLGPGYLNNRGRQATMSYVHIFGANATNDLVLAWQSQYPKRTTPGYGTVSENDLGIFGMPNGAQKLGTPYFAFNNFENLGATSDTLFFEWQTQNTLTDVFALTLGRHSLRMGGMLRKLLTNNLQPGGINTSWTFNSNFTNQPGIASTGFDYAGFLLGLPSAMTYSIFNDYFRTRASVYALFVQDDFRVNRKLSVNLGLRWDAPTWFHEAQNRSGVFSLAQGQYIQFGQNGFRNTPWENNWRNFNPRVGFAYSPFARANTVIRGGYGIFVAGTNSAGANGFMLTSPFFADSDQGRYSTTDQIHWNTTLDSIPYQPVDKTGRTASSVTFFPDRNPMTYVQQWNLNVQHQIGGFFLQAGYVGTRGSHLPYGAYNLNAIPVSLAPQASGRFVAPYVPYPQYPGGVTVQTWIGSSDYNSLQLKAERRFSNGLAFLISYTHSKMIDVGNNGYRDPLGNRSLERGLSQYNTPNRLVGSYNYQVPIGPGHRWLNNGFVGNIVGGWEIAGITTFQSGLSLTPALSVNNCVCGNNAARPNIVGDPGAVSQSLGQWFNTGAFSTPAQYTIGNSGVGILTGPHTFITDFNGTKRVVLPWREGMSLEFRAEFYNAFNHPQFSNPDVTLGNANFGKITGSVNPRKGQLALKLYW